MLIFEIHVWIIHYVRFCNKLMSILYLEVIYQYSRLMSPFSVGCCLSGLHSVAYACLVNQLLYFHVLTLCNTINNMIPVNDVNDKNTLGIYKL